MTREDQVLELLDGYANGLITDKECNEMTDIIFMEGITIKESDWCHYSGMASPKAYEDVEDVEDVEEWEANSLYSS